MARGDPREARKDRVRVGAGASEHGRARLAGRTAAEAAIAALDGEPPALVLVYGSVRYDLADLLAGVRSASGRAPLAGATSAGHFHNGELTEPGRGVAVLALTAGPYRFGVASVDGLRARARTAGRTLARSARDAARSGVSPDLRSGPHASPYSALMVLTDGLAGNQQDLLRGLHKVAGAAVPIVGGSAADDRRLRRTSVFEGDRVLSDGAVAVWIDSPWPLPVTASHGWRAVSLPLLVTKVDGPVVHEIAGRPADVVFREHLRDGAPDLEPGRPDEPGYHSAHAFGVIEPDGTLLVRGVYLDDDGGLRTFCPLSSYAPVQIVSCTADDLLAVTEPVVRSVATGRAPSAVLAFSCVGRLDVLRDRSAEEAARLQAAAGAATTFGLYTYGELARIGSATGYHNATLAAVAL